jgi:hypothetical protein
MAEKARPARRLGRPPRPPVRDEPISDIEAFWRLHPANGTGLNSFQAFRTLAFCLVWQHVGGSIEAVVGSRYCSKRSVFYRLEECHEAGFEPGCVTFEEGGPDWEGMKDDGIRHMKDAFAADLARRARRPWPIRQLTPQPRPDPDLEDNDSRV